MDCRLRLDDHLLSALCADTRLSVLTPFPIPAPRPREHARLRPILAVPVVIPSQRAVALRAVRVRGCGWAALEFLQARAAGGVGESTAPGWVDTAQVKIHDAGLHGVHHWFEEGDAGGYYADVCVRRGDDYGVRVGDGGIAGREGNCLGEIDEAEDG